MHDTFQSGALPDTRTDEQKSLDFQFKEAVASASPVSWIEKPQELIRKFPIFNQNGSGSCVAQTEAKEMGIMRWLKDGNYVHFSATDIYSRRANKPSGGMAAVDARNIATKGVTLESLCVSQNMTDAQMDGVTIESYKREVGAVFKVPNFLFLPTRDVDTIASVIQHTGKGVMVWLYFKVDEWTAHPTIKYPSLDFSSAEKHSVCAVDFLLVNGKKCLVIEDSWGTVFGMAGQRIIDEDFFKARNWHASYLMNFKFDGQVVKPHHTFTIPLLYGMTNNDVKALQDILKYEALFPSNIASSGYYGSISAKAILQWQLLHNVAPASELNPLQGKRVGQKTINALNAIYG